MRLALLDLYVQANVATGALLSGLECRNGQSPAKGLEAFFSLLLWSESDALKAPVRAWAATLSPTTPTITAMGAFVNKFASGKRESQSPSIPDHLVLYGGGSKSAVAFPVPLQPLRTETPCFLDQQVRSFFINPPGPYIVLVISKSGREIVRRDISIFTLPSTSVVMRAAKKDTGGSVDVDVEATLANVDPTDMVHVCDTTIPLFSKKAR